MGVIHLASTCHLRDTVHNVSVEWVVANGWDVISWDMWVLIDELYWAWLLACGHEDVPSRRYLRRGTATSEVSLVVVWPSCLLCHVGQLTISVTVLH